MVSDLALARLWDAAKGFLEWVGRLASSAFRFFPHLLILIAIWWLVDLVLDIRELAQWWDRIPAPARGTFFFLGTIRFLVILLQVALAVLLLKLNTSKSSQG